MSNRERGPRFEAAFAELVQGLGSESDDEAVAAMLLELNSFPVFPPNDDTFYERVIPQPLLERPLEPNEEECSSPSFTDSFDRRSTRRYTSRRLPGSSMRSVRPSLGSEGHGSWTSSSDIPMSWSCRSSTKRCTLLRGACPSKPTTCAIPISRNRCVEPTPRQRSSASLPPS